MTLHRWAKCESRLRPRDVLVRSELVHNTVKQQGGPLDVRIYAHEDLLAVLEGRDGEKRGAGTKLAQVIRLVTALKSSTPIKATKALDQGGAVGLSADVMGKAKEAVGLVSLRTGWRGPYYWCLPGQRPPAPSGAADTTSAADADRTPPRRARTGP